MLLAGGSAFGLEAACGVMRWLDERGLGYAVGAARVPIVPAAVLFDLRSATALRPDVDGRLRAVPRPRPTRPEGSVGAGTGATVGKLFGLARAMKGGIGTASARPAARVVGALVAVNAVGDVVDPATGAIVAGARAPDGRLGGLVGSALRRRAAAGRATTIGVVATDAPLTEEQANHLAIDGARRPRPLRSARCTR